MKGLKNFHKALCDLLKTESLFTDRNGELVIRTVIDKAWKTDHKLVKLLLSRSEIKQKFFDEISGHLVFNINTFIDYISDKNFLDNSYTRFRNKIGLNVNNKFLQERGEVSLVWPYKDCVLEGGQTKEEEKRREIFFNEILAQDEINRLFEPKVLTNWKRYTATGEEKISEIKRDENGLIKENLIIKGNNLLTLHTLKKQFQGKVKLIYIDPPYNTSGDNNIFTYNNHFNHSSWLTFMKNRLEIAKILLTKSGFIAIAIDHYELGYLIVLADEVFGRENRLGVISVVHKPEGRSQEKFFGTSNDFMLVYSKNKSFASFQKVIINNKKKEKFDLTDEFGSYKLRSFIRGEMTEKEKPHLFYPIYVSRDLKDISIENKDQYNKVFPISNKVKRVWFLTSKSLRERIFKKEIIAKKNNNEIKIFYKVRENEVFVTHWVDKKYNSVVYGTKWLKKIIGRKTFSYPKSIYTVLDTLKIMTDKNDIIVDFFAGSGTTGEAVMRLNEEDNGNRQFILIEQLDEHIKICKERVQKILNKEQNRSSFCYCELMKYNEAYMDKIQEAKSSDDLLSLWRDISKNSFLNWYVNPDTPEEAVNDFIKIGKDKNGLEKQKKLLSELLNKNQLYVNLSEIDDKNFNIREEDKKINKLFFQ